MKQKITIRGFLKNKTLQSEIKQMISTIEFNDVEISVCENIVDEIKKLKVKPDVLLVELDSRNTEELDLFQSFIQKYEKQTTVFVLLNHSESNVVRLLMRSGIHDVLSLPENKNEMLAELKGVIEQKYHGMQSVTSQVITFLNAKGGSGSTTIAVNTAYVLATKLDATVCLIDLDIQFGKVALFMDIVAKDTILDALRQPERIDPVFLKALITHHPSGLDILASPGSLNDISHISPSSIGSIIEAACQMYDYVLIDMPHVIMPWTIEAMKKADRNFLVVQSCFSIIRDAHLLLQKLPEFGVDNDSIELINNRDSKHTGPINKKQMADLLHKESAFSIHNNYALVIEAQESGKPLEKLTIGSNINRDIEHLAKAIKHGKTSKETASFFSKMFHH